MTRPTAPLPDVDAREGRSLVAVLSKARSDTPEQRRFQKLIGRIERERAELRSWEDYAHRYAQRLAREAGPVETQLRARQREMALLIGDLLSRRGQDPGARLRTSDRSTLRELLAGLLRSLPDAGADPELAALRAKHAQKPDRDERERMEMTEHMLKEVFGVELDEDHGATSVEELFEQAQRQLDERGETPGGSARPGGASRGAGDHARAAEPAPAAKPGSPSLQHVYRRLVSLLHPDREPDPRERERKNELMQRVNQAYEAHDLLTLLTLQVELAQIDAASLSSPERLAQYNEVLREQLSDLEAQVKAQREVYAPIMGRYVRTLSVKAVDRQLTTEIRNLQRALQALLDDLTSFRDPALLRARLDQTAREQQQEMQAADLMMVMEAAMEMDLDAVFGEPRRPRRRARRRGGGKPRQPR